MPPGAQAAAASTTPLDTETKSTSVPPQKSSPEASPGVEQKVMIMRGLTDSPLTVSLQGKVHVPASLSGKKQWTLVNRVVRSEELKKSFKIITVIGDGQCMLRCVSLLFVPIVRAFVHARQ